MSDTAAQRITGAIGAASEAGRPALVAYLTAGFPSPAKFKVHLKQIASESDVVEIGVPFSDPMADGMTIQLASRVALDSGVSLRWILDRLAESDVPARTPCVLMSYLNPLLAFGAEALAARAKEVGVCGFIVPDLPYEESATWREAFGAQGLALVQLVTPVTDDERLRTVCAASSGFVYAVTVTGTTGGAKSGGPMGAAAPVTEEVVEYLQRVARASSLPVCAGFGIREAQQVRDLGAHAAGVVVGSALVETLQAGGDPREFLRALKDA